MFSPAHITVQLVPPQASYTPLGADRPEMKYEFCRIVSEMTAVLANGTAEAPIFGHTRTLDLHVGNVPRFPVPEGASYPGFVPTVAAAVAQIDECFGRFIAALKQQGLYENSIVILSADHGDSLGERHRWGHAIHLFPEVLRIPLIVHVPSRLRAAFAADPAQIAFLADLTPTLYRLTGRLPADLGPLFGRPLFRRRGTVPPPPPDGFLVGSSYGAVYGVVRENGRRLYIVDAINGREYNYQLLPVSGAARVGILPEERQANRALIEDGIRQLARIYRYEPSQ